MSKSWWNKVWMVVGLIGAMMVFVPGADAQRRVDPNDKKIQRQHRSRKTGFRTYDPQRTRDYVGLRSSRYADNWHRVGVYANGAYTHLLHAVPDTRYLGGYHLGMGFTYEFQTSYFILQTGVGVAWQSVRDSVGNTRCTNHDLRTLTGDDRWGGIIDSYGVPVDRIDYIFTHRMDKARMVGIEVPVMVGVNIEGFYFLAGVKFYAMVGGNTLVKAEASTEASYESRYVGLYTEMDNHGYRHDVPLEVKGDAISSFMPDIKASFEIGYDYLYESWHFRIGAYADCGLLPLRPNTSHLAWEIPYESKWDFDTFRLNHMYTTPAAAGVSIRQINAGLKFTAIYEFPAEIKRFMGRDVKTRKRSYL